MAGFHSKIFEKHDDYMTPKYAFENIKDFIPKDKIIFDPFYGDGKSGKYLQELGFNTIHYKLDFFKDKLPEFDIILSNPPFSKTKEVMEKLKEIDKPFIIILPASKITTSYFRKWKNDNIQIIIPRKRIHFIKLVNGKTPDNWKNCCNFDCFYYCYKMGLEKSIIWLE